MAIRRSMMRRLLRATWDKLHFAVNQYVLPKITKPNVDSPLKKKAHQEKVASVENELRNLQAKCTRSGYTAKQVEDYAACFFHASRKATREKWAKIIVVMVFAMLFCYVLLQFSFPNRVLDAVTRTGMIKLLSVWDWTEMYYSKCLVDNPLYQDPDALRKDDCQICESILSIQHVSNVSANDVVDRFFKLDVPIIVDDGLKNWDDDMFRSPRDVAQMYSENEVLRSEGGCGFSSNVRLTEGGHRAFLKDLLTHNMSRYYAQWENCQAAAAKAFRSAYRRPYFLPPAVGTASTSWVFLSQDYAGLQIKRVPIEKPLVMLLQASGQLDIQVEAWTPCDQLCPVLTDTLTAGQVLVTTDFLWKTSYVPLADQASFTIGLGASF